MGNEMGNSNVTGVQEQDSLGIDDANKPTDVSQLSTDKTVQEDKLLDLDLDQKAAKESNAAEGRDNSVLQQTCQDREEEENTTLMANATVHAMEPSPIRSEDLISTEQEEATLIAGLVEQPIQEIRSEESDACSESSETIEGGEESKNEEAKMAKGEGEESRGEVGKMPNGEGTEQQDSLVAESSTGLIQKINSGDEMVQTLQMLNTVVENDLISAFDKNPDDEPKEESGKQEILAESSIQSNDEGEQDQTKKPTGFGAENKELKELDLDDPVESFYLETIESEMRTVCLEANNKETEIRPEAAPDRCYENASQVLEDDINGNGENGELRIETLPQNGEDKQLEKNSLEFQSPEISQITEELEDEGDMIEISGSLTHFVISFPFQEKETEHVSDGAGNAVTFPDTEESKGAQVQNSSSSSSDSDAEVSEEMQHSDTEIEVADYTEGLVSNCQKEALSVTEERERKPEECISACTELLMEEEVRANPNPSRLDLLPELEEQHLVIESRKRDTERCLPGFPEERQENAENFGLAEGSNSAERSEEAVNSEDQSLKQEGKTHVIRCADESNSAVESEKPETVVMNSAPQQENSETERISFDFQNPIPETRFSDVQSTKADIFGSQIFPQPMDVKTGTNGLKENHSEEDEPVTKVPIGETEVLIPGATKEDPREEETVSNETSSPNCNGSAIKRTHSVKSKPLPQKEDATAVDSLQMQETADSPDEKKIVATPPRMTRKQRSRSSLFSSCMCCTTVIQ